ncbi:MAG: ACT domain-containing protein [Acidimicrobiia bacterium]
MAWDITASLPNVPGTLASAAEALGGGGINIDGSCMVLCEGLGVFHMLVEGDATAARGALESAGVEVLGEREVLIVEIEDRPGELGRLARRVAEAGLNIELQYLATRSRVVLGVEDLEALRSALA